MKKVVFTLLLMITGMITINAQNYPKSNPKTIMPKMTNLKDSTIFDKIQIEDSSLFKEISNFGRSTDGLLTNIPGANAINMASNKEDLQESKGLSDSGHSTSNVHSIIIPEGWSGLSSYLIPADPTIENLFLPYQDQLIILYNKQGVYFPEQQVNTLQYWDTQSGYIAKFDQETSIEFSGQPVQNGMLDLSIGWNLIPVLTSCPVNVVTFFANQNVTVVREVAGWKLYWPQMSINTLEELLPGKAYYVLVNSQVSLVFPNCGTPAWQCGDSIVDARDDQMYSTVQIGDQCWMAQNLNVGVSIDAFTDQSDNGLIEKYCYNNDETNCDIYGGLYQWNEMMQYTTVPGSLGICPSGWHVPNNTEWTILATFLGGESVAGGQLKEAGTLHWNSPNTGATNNSGFTALPAGLSNSGYFYELGNFSVFGASSYSPDINVLFMWGLYYEYAIFHGYDNSVINGISVRCLKGTTSASEINIPSEGYVPDEAGSTNIYVNSNVSWTIEENVSWLNVDPMSGNDNDTISISYDENTSFDYREGPINVIADGGTLIKTISLVQFGNSDLSVSPEWQTVPSNAGTTTVEVTSNDSWTVRVDDSWLSAMPMSGSLNGTITVEYEANTSYESRIGYLWVSTIHGYGSSVFVEQQGLSFTVTPQEQYVTAASGTTTFEVTSFTSWTVEESVDWLSVSPLSGSDNGTLTVTYDENTSFDARIGQITITADGGTPVINVTLNQAGVIPPELTVNPISQNVTADSGNTTFEVNSNIMWTVDESVDWLSVSPASGSNNETLTVTYEENTSFDPRVGQIAITGDSGTPVVNVTLNQAGFVPTLSVIPANQNVFAEAGTTTFDVTSNTSWVVAENVDWLSVSPMNGSDNGALIVTYDENTSFEARVGQITITSDGGTPVVNVTLTQAGFVPTLMVIPANQNVLAETGTTTFEVTSNTSWAVEENVAWLSVSPMNGSENGTLTITYDANNSPEPRTGQIKIIATGGTPIINVRFSQEGILPWSCGISFIDPRDGQIYSTVQIGTQCWMAQNLNIGTYISSTTQSSNNDIIEKYCYYGIPNYCEIYGGLYQWNEIMQYSTTSGIQGICPTGWHVPTDAEWCTLTYFLDVTANCDASGWSGTNAGGKMKESGLTHWYSPNFGATNSSGFTGLPAGYRELSGYIDWTYALTIFWTSTESNGSLAFYRELTFGSSDIFRLYDDKNYGFSVRCLKDN